MVTIHLHNTVSSLLCGRKLLDRRFTEVVNSSVANQRNQYDKLPVQV
jgi:hypothetical protein